MRVLVGVLLANAEVASGFLGRLNVHAHVIAASMNRNDQLRRSAAKDDSPTSTEESSEASDASFFESLRARTETLLDERSRVVYNWRTGSCESHVGAALAEGLQLVAATLLRVNRLAYVAPCLLQACDLLTSFHGLPKTLSDLPSPPESSTALHDLPRPSCRCT